MYNRSWVYLFVCLVQGTLRTILDLQIMLKILGIGNWRKIDEWKNTTPVTKKVGTLCKT